MSAPINTATSAPAGTTTGRGRTVRRPLVIALLMVGALLVLSVLTRDDAATGGRLDPSNPDPDGGRAVASVLADQGVRVDVVRGQEALLDRDLDAGTAVVVTNPEQLGPSTLETFRRHAGDAGTLVVVGDAAVLGEQFDVPVGNPLDGDQPAGCDAGPAAGLVVRTYAEAGLTATGCFGDDDTAALVRQDRVWLLASPESVTNEHVLDADNGALALRLLGQQERLVWYVADLDDTSLSDAVRLSTLLPDFLLPTLWLLLLSVGAFVLWRGRRLGPVVTEPLPVVVRAAESTRARGQAYHRARDREHAAEVLVTATRRRLGVALRLPPGTPLATLVGAVAARTGRDPGAVAAQLAPPLIGKDSELVDLGQQLTRLENEVRTP